MPEGITIPPGTPWPRSGEGKSGPLLPRRVADRLEREIETGNLAAGTFLGREIDLQKRLGVSRPTLRAAIRFLELSGRIVTKVGVTGGVYVDEPLQSAALGILTRHIVMLGQPLPVFFAVYMPFFARASWLAAARATASQRDDIAHINARMIAQDSSLSNFGPTRLVLRSSILKASGCPSLELVGQAFLQAYVNILEGELKLGETERDKVHAIKVKEAAIVSAIVAGDCDATLAACQTAAEHEWAVTEETVRAGMVPAHAIPQTLFARTPGEMGSRKLAEHVMRAMRRDMHDSGITRGALMGTTADLAIRFGVSPEICREAIGLLALHGIVNVKRGRSGGIYAGEASLRNLEAVIDAELQKSGGLAELGALLVHIRHSLDTHGYGNGDVMPTQAFLDQLGARIKMAIATTE